MAERTVAEQLLRLRRLADRLGLEGCPIVEIEAPHHLGDGEAGWSVGYSVDDVNEIEDGLELLDPDGGVWWSATAPTLDEALATLIAQIEMAIAAVGKE